MKIELKNIKVNLAFSEETTMFKADVFVNGVKTAFAENDGRGGCTNISHYEGMKDTLRQAEAFAKTLPQNKSSLGDKEFSFDNDLEFMVDEMVDDFVNAKEKVKFEKKLKKAMEKSIVWGKPNGLSFQSWGWKSPIKAILMTPKGVEAVRVLYNKVKLELKEGEEILNKDLVEMFGK